MNVFVDKPAKDVFGRPDWDTWFMTLCFVVAQRSIDPSTKHGCVVVDDERTILSVGYNGPPRGCNDAHVPLSRPLKYKWLSHSEVCAIANAARCGIALKDSIFYITGFPCETCFRSIINVGAKKVIYGNVSSQCVDDDVRSIVMRMQEDTKIDLVAFDSRGVLDILKDTLSYFCDKVMM